MKSVGPEGSELFLQGKCKKCKIPLFGREPKERDLCGECSEGAGDNQGPEKDRDNDSSFNRC